MKDILSTNEQFLSIVDRIIEENLDNERFSVEELAREAGSSRSMLHRKLVKLTGKSAGEYITEKRLIRARELLEHNAATVSEIAYRVGFNSPSYFNKVFTKRFKITPGDLKKKAGSGQFINPEQAGPVSPKKISAHNFRIVLLVVIIAAAGTFTILKLIRPSEMSIAVLPLDNLTGTIDNDYFVAGMQDAIIDELGKIAELRVISRRSTLLLEDTTMSLKEIAQKLGVNTVVKGAVTNVEDSLMILIHLIDVFPKERRLLEKEYCDEMENVLMVHSSIVKDIAKKINIRLTRKGKQLIDEDRTVDPETYKAYLLGIYYLQLDARQGTKESFNLGMDYLQKAIDREPGDPLGYAGLALGYAGHGKFDSEETLHRIISAAKKAEELDFDEDRAVDPETYKAYSHGMHYLQLGTEESFRTGIDYLQKAIDRNPVDPLAYAGLAMGYITYRRVFDHSEETLLHAMSAAKKAIELDPSIDEAYAVLAMLYSYTWDWPAAKLSFEDAIANNPNNAFTHSNFAWYHVLFFNKEKSIYHAKKAASIDPLFPNFKAWVAFLYYYYKDFEEAENWASEALSIKSDDPWGNLVMSLVNLQKKDYDKAIAFGEKMPRVQIWSKGYYWKSLLGYIYVRAGQREKALAFWDELEEISKNDSTFSCFRGWMASYLGFTDKAFEFFNDAVDKKDFPEIYQINFYPCTEDIRNDPRYDMLLKRMNLNPEPSWLASK